MNEKMPTHNNKIKNFQIQKKKKKKKNTQFIISFP